MRPATEISEGRTAAQSVVAHHEHFGIFSSYRSFVKAESVSIEPLRARLHIVLERQPQALELPHFLAVLAVSLVDDVRDAQRLELLDVLPGRDGTAKRQPLAYPKQVHAIAPFVRT